MGSTINILLFSYVAVAQQDPEYMEQPSPTTDSKQLQENMERAISQAAAAAAATTAQDDTSPETLLNAVRAHAYTYTWTHYITQSDASRIVCLESFIQRVLMPLVAYV